MVRAGHGWIAARGGRAARIESRMGAEAVAAVAPSLAVVGAVGYFAARRATRTALLPVQAVTQLCNHHQV